MSRHREIVLTLLLLPILVGNSAAKPKMRITADGFPTGQDTPEGAASDLARAFIHGDAAGFRAICIRPYGAGHARAEYVEYLSGVSNHLKSAKDNASPDRPDKIMKVFAARHLSKNGPASYGHAAFGFQDVMFVDVEVLLHSGTALLRRTMVIKDQDAKWYVHPVPDVSPLLSDGFYDESPSVNLFTDVYEAVR